MGTSKPDATTSDALFIGAMPKEEIGALRLLKEHPTYDGRGCVIAIFDTGVDPAAADLTVRSPKEKRVLGPEDVN
jgi:tripeptidyl-peptidase II